MHTYHLTFVLWVLISLACAHVESDQQIEEKRRVSIPTVLYPAGSIHLPFPENCLEKKRSPDDYLVDYPTPIALIKDSIYLLSPCNSDRLLQMEVLKLVLADSNRLLIEDTLEIDGLRFFDFFNFSRMEGWDFRFNQDSKTAVFTPQSEDPITFYSTLNKTDYDFYPFMQEMICINQTLIYTDRNDLMNYYFLTSPKEDSILVKDGGGRVLGLNEAHQQLSIDGRMKDGRIGLHIGEKAIELDIKGQLTSNSGPIHIWYDSDSERLYSFHWVEKENNFSVYYFRLD